MNNLKAALKKELPFLFIVPALLWQLLFLFIPLGVIFYTSFIKNIPASWWEQFTFGNYQTILNIIHFRIIFRSVLLALGSSISCLMLAYPLAYFLAVQTSRWKNFLLFLLTLPFWTNFLVLIYSWFFLLEHNGIINTLLLKIGLISAPLPLATSTFAIYIVMVYCYLPFMIMPIYSVLEKLDKNLLEASGDLGRNCVQTFKRVTLPVSLSGIKTGFLLVLVATFGEFAIPALIGGSKRLLVGSLISHYFLVAQNNSVGSAFTMLSGLILVSIVVTFYYSILFAQKRRRAS